MARLSTLFQILGGCLIAAGWCNAARCETLPAERRIAHPSGAAITVRGLEIRDDSVVLSATIANPTDRELRLNRSRGFVLQENGRIVHHLNPPLDNPELAVPPHAETSAELVFIGPVGPAARQLTLSTNQGVGTADNPYDDAPVLRADLPVENRTATLSANQTGHPNGATLRVSRTLAIGKACLVSLAATNGNDRTIELNQTGSLTLTDERGGAATLKPPTENRGLVVPPGTRLDADLVFDCGKADVSGPLILTTNRGTAGTPDNPYETLPVFTLRLGTEVPTNAAVPAASRASVTPIGRSQLAPAAVIAAAPAPVTAPVAASRPKPSPAPSPSPPPRPPPPEPAASEGKAPQGKAPKTAEELQAALQAEKTDRGLRLIVPSDQLFEATGKTLRGDETPTLANLAALIASAQAREVVVIAHTDSAGSDDDNLALSEERARALAGWLKAHAAKPPPRFVEKFYGRTRPVAPNHKADGSDNPEGQAQNRRVEILIRRR